MAQSAAEPQDKRAQLAEDMEIHIEDTLYDQNELGPLEDYVNKQVAETANYDFESNLYLMKMYSLYPNTAKKDIVVKMLIKAMMNLPETDFTSLVYLIPVTMLAKGDNEGTFDSQIETILHLGQYLEDCEFDQFWREYHLERKAFHTFKSFEFEIRRYICQVIQSVYQNMSLSFLTDLLDYTDERAVEKCVAALDLGWEIDFQKDTVKIPKSEENSSEVKRSTQVMSTDSMTQILASLRM